MKCDTCIHSRRILSENGFKHICILSPKAAARCLLGDFDRYAYYDVSLLFADIDTIIDSTGGDGK